MARLGSLVVTSCAVVAAMAAALPAAAGPDDDGVSVDVSPSSIRPGEMFAVTVSGCTSGETVQVRIDPAGLVANAACDGEPGFASTQFLAGGPLAEPGSYEIVAHGSGSDLGRATLQVAATASAESASEPVKTKAAAAPDGVPESTTVVATTAPVEQEPAGSVPTTAPSTNDADPDVATTARAEERGAEPPTTEEADDDDLATTGSSATGGLAAGAALTLLAGVALVALGRRRAA